MHLSKLCQIYVNLLWVHLNLYTSIMSTFKAIYNIHLSWLYQTYVNLSREHLHLCTSIMSTFTSIYIMATLNLCTSIKGTFKPIYNMATLNLSSSKNLSIWICTGWSISYRNIYCKSRNLPETDKQDYSTDLQ